VKRKGEDIHEAHLATQSSQTRQDTRVSHSHEHAGRPKGSRPSPSQGAQAANRLTSLKTDAAFRRLRRGRVGRGKTLSLRWLPTRRSEVRVGIVVSKKVGNAVVRNRVRRRLRELLRKTHLPSCDLMVIARPQAAAASYRELARDLAQALANSGINGERPSGGSQSAGEK